MEFEFVIAVGVVLILGSALQSAAGFAFGMFAIPLLILLGCRSFEAIAIISVCGSVQTIIGLWSLRTHIHWGQAAWMIAIAGAMLPVGGWTLSQIDALKPDQIGQIFGGIVLAALLVQWIWRVRPRDQLWWGWGGAAMVISGFMSGMSGMGGPPAVLWIMAHTWSGERTRTTLWALFTGLTPFQVVFLIHQFGKPVAEAYLDGLMLAPITLLGILPGLWLGRRIPKPLLRQISYVILLLVSLYAIFGPFVRSVAS